MANIIALFSSFHWSIYRQAQLRKSLIGGIFCPLGFRHNYDLRWRQRRQRCYKNPQTDYSDGALWSGTNKNRDVSTGPLACPFARSLAPLTRPLALLAPTAALTHLLARSLHLLPRSGESEFLMSQNDLVLSHSAAAAAGNDNATDTAGDPAAAAPDDEDALMSSCSARSQRRRSKRSWSCSATKAAFW